MNISKIRRELRKNFPVTTQLRFVDEEARKAFFQTLNENGVSFTRDENSEAVLETARDIGVVLPVSSNVENESVAELVTV